MHVMWLLRKGMSEFLPKGNMKDGGWSLLKGNLIGIDLGSKYVGLSISDDLGAFAHPLLTPTIYYKEPVPSHK